MRRPRCGTSLIGTSLSCFPSAVRVLGTALGQRTPGEQDSPKFGGGDAVLPGWVFGRPWQQGGLAHPRLGAGLGPWPISCVTVALCHLCGLSCLVCRAVLTAAGAGHQAEAPEEATPSLWEMHPTPRGTLRARGLQMASGPPPTGGQGEEAGSVRTTASRSGRPHPRGVTSSSSPRHLL